MTRIGFVGTSLFMIMFATGMNAEIIVPAYTGSYDGVTNLNGVTVTLASALPNPATPSDIQIGDVRGSALLTDDTPVTLDLLYAGNPPVPNSLELALNVGASEALLLEFDLTSPDLRFAGDLLTGQLDVSVQGVQYSPTLTDAGLLALEGPLDFSFIYQPTLSTPADGVLVYGLSAITATPEPSTDLLVLGGFGVLLGFGGLPRRRFHSLMKWLLRLDKLGRVL
jgi:hypothetical protein